MYAPAQILGVPVGLAFLAVGIAIAIAGLLITRRLLTIEPQARSFRATTHGPGTWPLGMLIIGVALLVAVAAIILSR